MIVSVLVKSIKFSLQLLKVAPRYTGVRSGMAQFDLPLQEITTEEFSCAWTRFELVSTAKEWNTEKQVIILPTLFGGKLVESWWKAGGKLVESWWTTMLNWMRLLKLV